MDDDDMMIHCYCIIDDNIPVDQIAPNTLQLATRTPENIEALEKNATALRGRRNAIRQQKVQEIKGHQFRRKFFRQPTYCSLCHEFMW